MGRWNRWAALVGLGLTLLVMSGAVPAGADPLTIPFTINKPDGNGPFPAVVIMHDCSGLGPKSSGAPLRWSDQLVAAGYVTILPDSFSSRGAPAGVCTKGSVGVATYWDRSEDAKAALTHLQSLPFVDASRVAVMGGSHGGSSTLAAIVGPEQDGALPMPGFAGAIALYPNCAARYGNWRGVREYPGGGAILGYEGVFEPTAPLLILIDGADDWTPAAYCEELAARATAQGYPVDLVIYPGAHHAFDSDRPVVFRSGRRNVNAPGGYGATTGGDAEAWADAKSRVSRFLAKHLKGE